MTAQDSERGLDRCATCGKARLGHNQCGGLGGHSFKEPPTDEAPGAVPFTAEEARDVAERLDIDGRDALAATLRAYADMLDREPAPPPADSAVGEVSEEEALAAVRRLQRTPSLPLHEGDAPAVGRALVLAERKALRLELERKERADEH